MATALQDSGIEIALVQLSQGSLSTVTWRHLLVFQHVTIEAVWPLSFSSFDLKRENEFSVRVVFAATLSSIKAAVYSF